ncbi:MAG: hypothetical protein U9O94_05105 [Nanoarchaeota archaeon]|nr:hypothetical protein [Nanoarchaeota archaeon]
MNTTIDCSTINLGSPPVIDMGGSGQDLVMPSYSGIVTTETLSSEENGRRT